MALTKIEFGSLADPDVVNNNFEYLEEMITDTSAKIYTNNASLESKISTLSNSTDQKIQNLSDQVTGGITDDITDLNKDITSINTKLNNIFDIIAPNYKAGFDIASGWTATKSGYVNWYSGAAGNSTTRKLYVNGIEVGHHNYYKYGDPHRIQFMIRKGDVITFESGTSAKFFPCRGGI